MKSRAHVSSAFANQPALHQVRARRVVLASLCIVVCASFGIVAGHWYLNRASTPSCSWPMRVHGSATPQQIGLVRCYLKDLSMRDTQVLAGLMAVTTQGDRITATDLQHSEDARSGLATALFSQNPSDTTNVSVAITFADGVTPPPSGFRRVRVRGSPH